MIQSPCVANCGLNDQDYCMGCGRHIDEIVSWSQVDDSRKQAIIDALPARKKAFSGQQNTQTQGPAKWHEAKVRLGLE